MKEKPTYNKCVKTGFKRICTVCGLARPVNTTHKTKDGYVCRYCLRQITRKVMGNRTGVRAMVDVYNNEIDELIMWAWKDRLK